jgi:hypothetical protein
MEFYDFGTDVHLVGFYSILSLMMHGAMNVNAFILIPVDASTCSRMQLHVFWSITPCRLVNN